VELDTQLLDPRLARLVPLKIAETHRAVPLRLEGARESVLVVAIAAPASLDSLDTLKSVSGKARVVARLATDAAIRRAIGRLYRGEVHEVPREELREGFVLPDAEEFIPFVVGCMAEDVFEGQAAHAQPAVLEDHPFEMEQDGLPLLSPLELDPPPSHFVSLVDAVLGPPPELSPAATLARVLIYGWGADSADSLVTVLDDAGIAARVASAGEILEAGPDSVVVAPLPWIEALGQRVSAQLVVAGKAPEDEFMRAEAVGARGFLESPVDGEFLLRAVQRMLRLANESLTAAS
jgi:type IV pilus assembly protein PilB